jgi:hypothetical protein
MSDKSDWEGIYSRKSINEVSWYREHLNVSSELIAKVGLRPDAAIIDIGGGVSTLVDDLL